MFRAYVQNHVISEICQLVPFPPSFRYDLDMPDLRDAERECGKQTGMERQLLLLLNPLTHPLAHCVAGHSVACLLRLYNSVERFQQRQAPYVPEEDCASIGTNSLDR